MSAFLHSLWDGMQMMGLRYSAENDGSVVAADGEVV